MAIDIAIENAAAAKRPRDAAAVAPSDAASVPVDVTLVTTAEGLDALRDEWIDLEDRCAGALNYFQTYTWNAAWYHNAVDRCAPDRPELMIVACREAGRLVLVWPLVVEAQNGVRVLRWMSEPHLQYGDVLVDSTAIDHERAMGEAWRVIANVSDCDAIHLAKVLEGGTVHGFLSRQCAFTCNENTATRLDLRGFETPEDYRQSLGKKRRRRHNQRRNRLDKLGAVSFDVHVDDADYADAVATALTFKQRWLRETGLRSSTIHEAATETFLSALGGADHSDAEHVASVLRIDGVPVAIELGFVFKNHYYAYLGAFDWDHAAHSVGKVQMDLMVEWCIERGCDAYDLLGTPTTYKSEWADRETPMIDFCHARTLAGRAHIMWLTHLRPRAKRAFEDLAADKRRALSRMIDRFATRRQASA